MTINRLDKFQGCLLGGACGDARGYPVEFLDMARIREICGPNGIEKLEREQKQIDQIIREIDPKRVHEYYEVQEAILESLDQEHKGKFEALIDDLVAWGEEECKAVYVAAFFEGLRLGHKAF